MSMPLAGFAPLIVAAKAGGGGAVSACGGASSLDIEFRTSWSLQSHVGVAVETRTR